MKEWEHLPALCWDWRRSQEHSKESVMQKNDVKNANQGSVGSQQKEQQKKDLNKPEEKKPGSSSSRIVQTDEKFSTSQSPRNNK